MKLMIAKQHCSDLNLNHEQEAEVHAKTLLKFDEL